MDGAKLANFFKEHAILLPLAMHQITRPSSSSDPTTTDLFLLFTHPSAAGNTLQLLQTDPEGFTEATGLGKFREAELLHYSEAADKAELAAMPPVPRGEELRLAANLVRESWQAGTPPRVRALSNSLPITGVEDARVLCGTPPRQGG